MEEEIDQNAHTEQTFKLICSDYPSEFFLDKALCKTYFRQFGKVKRLTFKPKQKLFSVEYTNEDDFVNALTNAGEFNGETFNIYPDSKSNKSEPVRRKKKVVTRHAVSYVDSNEVNEELAAMGGYAELTVPSGGGVENIKNIARPKIKRMWKKEEVANVVETNLSNTKVRKKVEKKPQGLSPEQQDLLKIVKSQAITNEEKYRLLDARDKLLRIKRKKSEPLKSAATVGTCPDMCPEKERLMRESQHQVALYEQDDNDRHKMNPNKMVKQYSRSSADQESPLPHELRPVSVLQMTMTYLMEDIMDLCESSAEVNIAEWFHFLWDRTRGIRKDITQQALCCQGSVQLVQQCARFHVHCSARLVAEDPSVFDQKINTENLTKCLQTLKYMYHDLRLKGVSCPEEAEFRAYVILLNLNDGNFMWEVQEFDPSIQKSPEVKFALQVYSAFEKRNYVKFFKLVKSTTYLNACILMRYFVQVRVNAVEIILRCFTPPKSFSLYPIKELTELLAFDDQESTIDFMRTYGMSVNQQNTHFVLIRSAFSVPEFPYLLDRSLNVVESKRTSSVGNVVCGDNISPELNMLILNHVTHSSFDDNGYLIFDEDFNEFDSETVVISDEEPTQKVITKPQATNVFVKPLSESIKKMDPSNIFPSIQENFAPKETQNRNIFAQQPPSQSPLFKPAKESSSDNIFNVKHSITSDEPDTANIFKKPAFSQPIHQEKSSNLFQKAVENQSTSLFGQSAASKSIFAPKQPSNSNIFGVPQANLSTGFQSNKPEEPKKGGFTFALPKFPQEKHFEPTIQDQSMPVSKSFSFGSASVTNQMDAHHWHRKNEEEKELAAAKKKEEEIRKLEERRQQILREINKEMEREEEIKREREQRRIESEKRKREEEERIKREEEARIIAEETRKRADEARKRAEAEKRRQEELENQRRKELEELRKTKEREESVKVLLEELVNLIDDNIREERLLNIRSKIRRRMMMSMFAKWKEIVAKSRKKRKAMDCGPGWINTRSPQQCAEDLHTKSQDLTLENIKRYKSGRAIELFLPDEPEITPINMFKLTYAVLRRRLYEVKEKWHKNVYWKVTISVPCKKEMPVGLKRFEDTLNSLIKWEQNGIYYVENHKTATFCLEKQTGIKVDRYDSNGFVFIAKKFNDYIQRRIFENLKEFGVYTKLPIVLVLENPDITGVEQYLTSLKKTGIVSEFLVYVGNFTPEMLVQLVQESLVFLAKHVEKSPELELDTLKSFLTKNLCAEIWKKASSFAKWNSEYKLCMKDPDLVISLYNEGVRRLKDIVLNEATREHAVFPEVFRRYLPNTPDFLPCNYRYFPDFWTDSDYIDQLSDIFNKLTLPEFCQKWPPETEIELFEVIQNYCSKSFKYPKNPTLTLFNVLKDQFTPDFKNNQEVSWIKAIETLAIETLKEQDLNLSGTKFEHSVFKSFIVVYNINQINEYISSDWFYRNNPTIKNYKKKHVATPLLNPRKRKPSALVHQSYNDDLSDVIAKAESVLSTPKLKRLSLPIDDLDCINKSLNDLENSIRIMKKVGEMNVLKNMLEEK